MNETLTREQILAMEPGEELDVLVGEKVFNLQLKEFRYGHWHYVDGMGWQPVPIYSRFMASAWEVVETLQASHMYTDIRTCADFYEVWVTVPPFLEEEHKTVTVSSPKIPEAICKAALLAVMDL